MTTKIIQRQLKADRRKAQTMRVPKRKKNIFCETNPFWRNHRGRIKLQQISTFLRRHESFRDGYIGTVRKGFLTAHKAHFGITTGGPFKLVDMFRRVIPR